MCRASPPMEAPLRDEGEAYARKLKEAGVSVTSVRYNGVIHDFVLLNAILDVPEVQAAIRQASEAIGSHLGQKARLNCGRPWTADHRLPENLRGTSN